MLEKQKASLESVTLELKEKNTMLETDNEELRAKLNALNLENQKLTNDFVEASNEVDNVNKIKNQFSNSLE